MQDTNESIGEHYLTAKQLQQSSNWNLCEGTRPLRYNRHFTEKLTLSWKNVNVYASKETFFSWIPGKESSESHLLANVSGEAKYGRILAIMGSSGAGKTTLLGVLSGRHVDDYRVEGLFAINGEETDTQTVKSLSAIVEQEDIFLSNLTVREHIHYQALLRMSGKYNSKQIADRTNEIIHELELTQCMDIYIGGLRRKGISGGEKKRVSLACEILGSPSILFLDEPTSGLDLYVAEKIVTLLRKLSSAGETIICTIHQPSSAIFQQFDDLLLLSEGRVAFMGKANDALSFFEQQGYTVPDDFNPADVYINSLAIDCDDMDRTQTRAKLICDAFKQSPLLKQIKIDNSKPWIYRTKYKSPFWIQFIVYATRTFKNNWREKLYVVLLIQEIVSGFLLGFPFSGQPMNQTGIKNSNGAFIFVIVIILGQLSFLEIRLFYEEYPLYKRELESGIYSITASFWAYSIAQLPLHLLSVLLFIVIYYIILGIGGSLTYFINYTLTLVLLSQTTISFVYCFRNCLLPLNVILKIVVSVLRLMYLISGTFIDYSTLPKIVEYYKSISFTYLANEILIINHWQNVNNISCEALTITKDTVITTKVYDSQCIKNGTKVIESLNYDSNNFEINIAKLIVLLLIYRIIANIILCLRMKRF